MPKGKNKKRKQRDFEPEEETYTVERIIKRRIVEGRTEYLLKWMNYPESESTWEPHENLDCPELIAEFEKKTKEHSAAHHPDQDTAKTKALKPVAQSTETVKKKTVASPAKLPKSKAAADALSPVQENGEDNKVEFPSVTEPNGFDKGLVPEEILGATEMGGQILFLIKWKTEKEPELVYASDANVQIPQMVIKFYESKLTWHDVSED